MTNTTKTLDGFLKAHEAYLEGEVESSAQITYELELIKEVWNLALDACRDAIPGESGGEGFDGDWIACREQMITAIDSLRTVKDKETV